MSRACISLFIFVVITCLIWHSRAQDDGGGIVSIRTFNGTISSDLDAYTTSLASIAYGFVWNVTDGTYFNLSVFIEFPSYTISIPNIVDQRENISTWDSSIGFMLDPCVRPSPIYDIVSIYWSASSDGRGLSGLYTELFAITVGHLSDLKKFSFLCPRGYTTNCVRYYVIEVKEPSPDFSFYLNTEFNCSVVLVGGNDSCPTQPQPGGVYMKQDIVAGKETMFELNTTNIKLLWLQVTAPQRTNGTIVMSYDPNGSSTPVVISLSSVIMLVVANLM